VLERELQASRDRFEVGDLTRTDVAQSDARLANARSQLQVAQGQLATARNAYMRVVGRPAEDLQPVPPLPPLPRTSGQAVDLANVNNPNLLAARYDEAAARYDVTGFERQRLPTIGVNAGAGYSQYDGGSRGTSLVSSGVPSGTSFGFFSQSATLQATIPLYQAGQIGSQIRQAQERRNELLAAIGAVGRQVAESATNAVVSLQTSRALIQSSQVAVDANMLALEGVKQENQVGTRTVLEVLNAEQELLQTRANLVSARRDEYVAGYTLLAAVGQAEGDALAVSTDTYDPTVNARAVRHKWNDFEQTPNPPPLPLPDSGLASRSVPIGPPR
jgi:outer membrane protein